MKTHKLKSFFDIKVLPKITKKDLKIEIIIVCDIENSYDTYLKLKKFFPKKEIIVPKILNIKKGVI